MKRLGWQAYRFSTAWPRIFPAGKGRINQLGLDFYARFTDTLLEADIEPFVTLHHWDLPQALEDEGGWPNRDVTEYFVAYTAAVTRRLGDRVSRWRTINEPAISSSTSASSSRVSWPTGETGCAHSPPGWGRTGR